MTELNGKKSDIKNVTDETYEEMVWNGRKKVLLILGAAWCGDTVNLLEKVLPPFVEKYSDEIQFLVVEIESEKKGEVINPRMKTEFDVQIYPTIVAFNHGEFVGEEFPEESREKGSQEKAVRGLLSILGVL